MDPTFYDRLAAHYHLLYPDWERSIERQGAALAALLDEMGAAHGARVRDVACGIGTQTIGLLTHGYRVTASDISPGAVARARAELLCRGLDAEVTVADMRALPNAPPPDALIACDNAVLHLHDDDEILDTLRHWRGELRPGGTLVLSLRDYDTVARKSPDIRPFAARAHRGGRLVVVQVWEWEPASDVHDVHLYMTLEREDDTCETRVLHTRHRAVSVARVMELAREAGFVRVERRDGVLFQPVIVAQRPR